MTTRYEVLPRFDPPTAWAVWDNRTHRYLRREEIQALLDIAEAIPVAE